MSERGADILQDALLTIVLAVVAIAALIYIGHTLHLGDSVNEQICRDSTMPFKKCVELQNKYNPDGQ